MKYNTIVMLRSMGHHIDAMDDPNHPLANHELTGQMIYATHKHLGGDKEKLKAGIVHLVNAMNDPSVNHPTVEALRRVADHLHGHDPHLGAKLDDSGMPEGAPKIQPAHQKMTGDPHMDSYKQSLLDEGRRREADQSSQAEQSMRQGQNPMIPQRGGDTSALASALNSFRAKRGMM